MINGMNIFYNSKIGQGLKAISNNKGNGLQPVQNKSKKAGSCNKECNKRQFKSHGLKILQ